ncbi:hypothetical protein BTA51_00025 [Hahella sp. CCB-MM4]|uniref:flagellar motor switch protein FliM n=1 Tax=Hahella sp. (strain CCB-MM4) TaxID=1926491 RepID=UPI000B9A6ED4|nr:flagellar motor switch protein FliM [Hahella sp. CCB-MM4]OZG74838.1 hypothetical protein BTA51_00025 [Hahella sp. CCB-MM4]
MVVRPFIFYRQNVIEKIRGHLLEKVTSWYQNWFGQAEVPSMELFQGDQHPGYVDTCQTYIDKGDNLAVENGVILAWENSQIILQKLAKEDTLHADVDSELSRYLMEKLAKDFSMMVANGNTVMEGQDCAEFKHTSGSGWLTGFIMVADMKFCFCIPPSIVSSLADSLQLPLLQKVSGDLEPVVSGCKQLVAEMSAELIPLELTLGELLEIQVGDVIRLDHPLEEPAVLVCGGEPLLKGTLGISGERKAIKLVS